MREVVAREDAEPSAFDKWIEANDKQSAFDGSAQEPNTLEICYARNFDDSVVPYEKEQEVVFEDPETWDRRPRLLVSLQSVLALKSLCEREFAHVEALTKQLSSCRTAYFKELLWLREQLVIATRPDAQVLWDYVMSYEVYWYDPPGYVDAELKEFMLDCNRITNKKLIEEIYELKLQLAGHSLPTAQVADDDSEIRRLFRKLGPSKFLKRLVAIASSKDTPPEAKAELEETARDLFAIKADAAPVVKEAKVDNSELEDMKHMYESLTRRYKNLEKELEEAKRMAQLEKERADAERARAEAERERAEAERLRADSEKARADKAQEELNRARKSKGVDPSSGLREAAEKAADAIGKAIVQIARSMNVTAPATVPSAGGRLEGAVQSLEKLAAMKPNIEPKEVVKNEGKKDKAVKPDNKELEEALKRIKELEELLKLAREAEERARADSAKSKKRDDDVGPVQPVQTPNNDKELKALRKAKEEAERIAEEQRKLAEKYKEEVARLKEEIKRLEARKPGADPALVARLKKAEEEIEALAMRLGRAQDKIEKLKEELKKYKRMAGEDVNSDDEDSDWEGDIPKFLISYFRRIRNVSKPRWELLSEDASLARKKREWLFSMKSHVQGQPQRGPVGVLQSEASAAFSFLRYKEQHAEQRLAKAKEALYQGRGSNSAQPAAIPDSPPPVMEPIYMVKPGHTVGPYIRVGSREVSPSPSPTAEARTIASAAAAAASAAAAAFSDRNVPGSGALGAAAFPPPRSRSGSPHGGSPLHASPLASRSRSPTADLPRIGEDPEQVRRILGTSRPAESRPPRAANAQNAILASHVEALSNWTRASMERGIVGSSALPASGAAPAVALSQPPSSAPQRSHPMLVDSGRVWSQAAALAGTTAPRALSPPAASNDAGIVRANRPAPLAMDGATDATVAPSAAPVVREHTVEDAATRVAPAAPKQRPVLKPPSSWSQLPDAPQRGRSPAPAPLSSTMPSPAVPAMLSAPAVSSDAEVVPLSSSAKLNKFQLSAMSTTSGTGFGAHAAASVPISAVSRKAQREMSVAQFSPALGSAPTTQAQRSIMSTGPSSSPPLIGGSAPSPPVRRAPTSVPRSEQVYLRSQSSGALPLTNAGMLRQPARQKHSWGGAQDDGLLPEALPPLPARKIKKQPAHFYALGVE